MRTPGDIQISSGFLVLEFYLLTWLSSLQPDPKGGLEILNLFLILPLRGKEILKQGLGANMLMFF